MAYFTLPFRIALDSGDRQLHTHFLYPVREKPPRLYTASAVNTAPSLTMMGNCFIAGLFFSIAYYDNL